MDLNIQNIVDNVFERSIFDRFKPVTQYEYKQREGRHMMDSAQLNDEVLKMREALEVAGIEVAEKATDAEIITAMLTEEKNFEHQMEVNNYNERVTRYKEGSLVERVRIMFNGAPEKPKVNPTVDEDFQKEKPLPSEKGKDTDGDEKLTQDEIDEIESMLLNVKPEDLQRLKEEGKGEEAAELADEIQKVLRQNLQADMA